jgi:ubiquinone/menaquinone biosynthesis C-methylase UbiE
MSQDESIETTERKKQVQKIFDGAAPVYDQIGPQFFSHYGRRLVEVTEIPAGSRVLDVATGRGAVLFPAAEGVGPEGEIIGIDLSETMVQETARKINQLKLSKVMEVRQMDAEYLDFPDDSFDYVLCGFAIFFFPQLWQALGEFRRVLKPGGTVCVSTFDESFGDEWVWLYDIVDELFPPEPEEQESEPEPEPDSKAQPVFNTTEGLQEILEKAGFGAIRIISECRDFIYATEEEFWSSLWSHGFRRILERIDNEMGEEGLQEFKKEVFAQMRSKMKMDGFHQSIAVHFGLASKPKVD